MQGVYHWVSNQVRDSGEYALDRKSGHDQTGQCHNSMNNIWWRNVKARVFGLDL